MLKSTRFRTRRKKPRGKIDWVEAPDIKARVDALSSTLELTWVNADAVKCFRSTNAHTRAYARIWGLTRIWQQALNITPTYVIEVISERFDPLSQKQQDEILLHELAHIPQNFSGSLVPHTKRGKGSFHAKLHEMIRAYHDKR